LATCSPKHWGVVEAENAMIFESLVSRAQETGGE